MIRKILLSVFILAAFATPGRAQQTNVTGTVVDPNGIPYSGATLKVSLTPTTSGQLFWTGGTQAQCVAAGAGSAPCKIPFTPPNAPLELDSTGSFTTDLYPNGQISPAGTQWLFQININAPGPLGAGPVTFSTPITISGASQSVSSTLTTLAPSLLASGFSPVAVPCTGTPNSVQYNNSGTFGCVGIMTYTPAGGVIITGNSVNGYEPVIFNGCTGCGSLSVSVPQLSGNDFILIGAFPGSSISDELEFESGDMFFQINSGGTNGFYLMKPGYFGPTGGSTTIPSLGNATTPWSDLFLSTLGSTSYAHLSIPASFAAPRTLTWGADANMMLPEALAQNTANCVDGLVNSILTTHACAGSGTVTSIATTSPIGGGTITTTGTLTCATCVVASSPGVGLAHFAGATQTVTSSAVSLTADVTGILPVANGGTNASTPAAALVNLLPAGTRIGDILYCSAYSAGACTTWGLAAGNNSGTQYLQETSAGAPSWTTPAGAGTVTSIATTSPIGGGTITTTGTLTCATCVVASSPGAGLSRFAGSTQTVTSAELSGDVTTSGSNAATVVQIEGGAIPASSFFVGTNSSKQVVSNQPFVVNAQTSTYQVLAADFAGCKTIAVASGTFTVTLVASGSQPASGQCVNIFNYGSGVVTIARSGQNINGAAANITLNAGTSSTPTSASIVSDGANYEATVDQGTVGTVTSVAETVPSGLAVSGSPVTGSGTLGVTWSVSAGGQMVDSSASNTAAFTATPTLGTDNSVAGTLQLANGSSNAHTTFASGATTSNTVKGFTVAPTTGDVVTCTTSSTTCTLTDSGLTTPSAAGNAVVTQTIASGSSAMATSAIGSGACATVVTATATGAATTDNILADFNADPTSTTGYSPSSSGMLTIIKYPTSGNVNFKVCNNTSSSITPGAVTLNWRVVR